MSVRLIIHSSSFRQATYVAFFCLILSSASIFLSDYFLKEIMHTHLKDMILDDIKNKSALNLFDDSSQLAVYLKTQKQANQHDELISYTFDHQRRLLQGDISILSEKELAPIFHSPSHHLTEIMFHQSDRELFGMAVPLADGGYYYASYDIQPMLNSTRIIPLMTGAVLFAVLLSILLVSLPFSIKNMTRVNRISQVMREYADGHHLARVVDNGYNDEFGRLSHETNTLLARTHMLMEQVRTVNSHIAHELKTPLTRVKHRLINTATYIDNDEALHELDEAASEIDRILYLFRAIMQLTEVENGLLSLRREPVCAVRLLEEVSEYYEPLLEQNQIELKLSAQKRQTFHADYALIFQAVANLLDNAIKYAPESSVIEMRVEQYQDTTCIHVIDQGPGIPPDKIPTVIERFQRINTHDTSVKGFGLGLPFVQAVAERHQGSLSLANSHPGLRVSISCRDVVPATSPIL